MKRIPGLRIQYHFRPSEKGFFAWHVHKLIEASSKLPVIQVPMQDFEELRENYWYQFGNEPTVESIMEHWQLAQKADLNYPIILCPQGRLMDGMHRLCRAVMEGKETIDAVQFPQTPEADYVDVNPEDLSYE